MASPIKRLSWVSQLFVPGLPRNPEAYVRCGTAVQLIVVDLWRKSLHDSKLNVDSKSETRASWPRVSEKDGNYQTYFFSSFLTETTRNFCTIYQFFNYDKPSISHGQFSRILTFSLAVFQLWSNFCQKDFLNIWNISLTNFQIWKQNGQKQRL